MKKGSVERAKLTVAAIVKRMLGALANGAIVQLNVDRAIVQLQQAGYVLVESDSLKAWNFKLAQALTSEDAETPVKNVESVLTDLRTLNLEWSYESVSSGIGASDRSREQRQR